jgi:CheY-like chemotaxis protein
VLEKILVVDDEPLVRLFVVAMLENNGFAVLEASSGEEGLQCFSQNSDVKLVLSDLLMPGMSGLEMTRRILTADQSVKVLFMTGMDPNGSLTELPKKQYSLLQKPFTLDILLKSVHDCLAAENTGSSASRTAIPRAVKS